MYADRFFKDNREFIQGLLTEKIPEPVLDKEEFLKVNFFPKQRDYIVCQKKYQTLFGGKRGGKSASNAGKIIWFDNYVVPKKPGYMIYASTTVEQAKRLAVKRLAQASNGLGLKWNFILGKNTIETERNIIIFAGLKDLKAVYSHQGIPVKLVIIDEPQFIKEECLKAFIMDVVALGMVDFQGEASCSFTGNPFPVHSGYLWDMIQNKDENVEHFVQNLSDNTFIKEETKQSFIRDELKVRGETMETLSNSSKRLIFGQWAEDDGHLVLSFREKDKHFFEGQVPNKEACDCIMGVDLGYDDKTAIVALYYDHKTGNIYIDEEFQEIEMTVIPLAKKIKEFFTRHDTKSQNIIDTQGGGKQTALTLAKDYDIPIIPAKKSEKIAWINLMRSFNKMGRIKIRENSALLNDSKHIIFNKHFTKLDEDHFHSDIFHAVLYGFKFIYEKHIHVEKNKGPTGPLDDILHRIKEKEEKHKKTVEKRDYGIEDTFDGE